MKAGIFVFGCWLLSSASAVFFLGLCAQALVEERRAQRRGEEPKPGVRFTIHWAGGIGLLEAMGALALTAGMAGRQEGLWRLVPLVLVNLIMQPLCLLFVGSGVRRVVHALAGRLTYAGQVIPPESIPTERYRSLWIERVVSGVVVTLVACGLSCVCALPLLLGG